MLFLERRHQQLQIGLFQFYLQFLGRCERRLKIVSTGVEIERVGRRYDADEHKHDQPHPLLAIVGAVRKAHCRAGADEEGADPAGGRLVPFWWLVEFLRGDELLAEHEQAGSEGEADQRRENQGHSHLARLMPIDSLGERSIFDKRIHHPHPNDRTDQGVRTRGGQAAIPGGEVPDDRCPQKREHHRQATPRFDIHQEIDREEVDDAESHPDATGMNADEVPDTRPDHRPGGLHRLRIDDRRHSVGGVVEAVDALKPEGDQERHQKQNQLSGAEAREGVEKFHGNRLLIW